MLRRLQRTPATRVRRGGCAWAGRCRAGPEVTLAELVVHGTFFVTPIRRTAQHYGLAGIGAARELDLDILAPIAPANCGCQRTGELLQLRLRSFYVARLGSGTCCGARQEGIRFQQRTLHKFDPIRQRDANSKLQATWQVVQMHFTLRVRGQKASDQD